MNTTLESLTLDELTTIANALQSQILHCDAQIESGLKWSYNVEDIREDRHKLFILLDKVLDLAEDLTS